MEQKLGSAVTRYRTLKRFPGEPRKAPGEASALARPAQPSGIARAAREREHRFGRRGVDLEIDAPDVSPVLHLRVELPVAVERPSKLAPLVAVRENLSHRELHPDAGFRFRHRDPRELHPRDARLATASRATRLSREQSRRTRLRPRSTVAAGRRARAERRALDSTARRSRAQASRWQ